MGNLSEIAVIWAIGLTAMIVAINARGIVRALLSWLLTLGVLALCLAYTAMNVDELRQRFLDGAASEEQQFASPQAEPAKSPAQPSPAKLSGPIAPAADSDDLTKQYYKSADAILASANACASSIASFNVTSLSGLADSDYEREQSRALSLRNQAAGIARLVKALQPTSALLPAQASLEKASENLRLAGWAVHAYFSAENDADEQNYHSQFQRYALAAQDELRRAQKQLETLR